ncbi:hypothetical protein [Nocardioides terrisoli]|uniref:hypothetical protein n=1 Tax=Nocardioides terrisoli TaxID=3388267 RepID=UPI00287B7FCE|nr:hypothetical protein [Nocardioides marmorisolisilvae]
MLQYSPAPSTGPTPTTATYGQLMHSTHVRVDQAIRHSCEHSLDALAVRDELAGYEQFLHVAGIHLRMLLEVGGQSVPGTRRLARRLIMSPGMSPATASADRMWHSAALHLGAAHDIVATHIDRRNQPRTPDVEDVLITPGGLEASRALTELVLDVLPAGEALLQSAIRAQRHTDDRPVDRGFHKRIHGAHQAIRLYGGAAMWELRDIATSLGPFGIDELGIAQRLSPGPCSASFENSTDALRLLRQISFSQAHAQVGASPASLRDLTQLGTSILAELPTTLDEPGSGLDRVRRAHLEDQLDAARAAWASAGTGLTKTIQGVTKAPRAYADAIQRLRDPATLTPPVRIALTAALPRFATEASTIVRALSRAGSLESPQRVPCQLRHEWRPITPAQEEALVSGFTLAASTSRHVVRALRDIAPQPERDRPAVTSAAREAPRLEVHRSASR